MMKNLRCRKYKEFGNTSQKRVVNFRTPGWSVLSPCAVGWRCVSSANLAIEWWARSSRKTSQHGPAWMSRSRQYRSSRKNRSRDAHVHVLTHPFLSLTETRRYVSSHFVSYLAYYHRHDADLANNLAHTRMIDPDTRRARQYLIAMQVGAWRKSSWDRIDHASASTETWEYCNMRKFYKRWDL